VLTGRLVVAALAVVGAATFALAEETYNVSFINNRIEPAELNVPAGQAFELVVKNADATPEEFESHDLDLEKLIPSGQEVTFSIEALEPGRYAIFGEFHQATAQGAIVVE
jgi:plastocyanin